MAAHALPIRSSSDENFNDLYDQVLKGVWEEDGSTIETPVNTTAPSHFPPVVSAQNSHYLNGSRSSQVSPVVSLARQPVEPLVPQATTPKRTPRPLPQLPPGVPSFPEAHPSVPSSSSKHLHFPDEKASGAFDRGYTNGSPLYEPAQSGPRRLPMQPAPEPIDDNMLLPPRPVQSGASYLNSPLDPMLDVGRPTPSFAPSYDHTRRDSLPDESSDAGPRGYFDQRPVQGTSQSNGQYPRWQDLQDQGDLSRTQSGRSTSSSGYYDPMQGSSSQTSLQNGVHSAGSYSRDSALETTPDSSFHPKPSPGLPDFHTSAGGPSSSRRNEFDIISSLKQRPLELHEESEDEFFDDSDEEDESRFVNLALLSHLAVKLRDKVPRGTHVKGSIPYPRAFTGKDIVSTIQTQIQRELLKTMSISTTNRTIALAIARSLQGQLFFYEVEWEGKSLTDGVEDVFMFLDDQEGASDMPPVREELPTGVVTFLTKCYASTCTDEDPCYSYVCPRRETTLARVESVREDRPSAPREQDQEWGDKISQQILNSLPGSEVKRQTIIHKIVKKEEQYLDDLDLIERLYLKPLRSAQPPIIASEELDDFIDTVFGNVLDLRECNKRLLEDLYVRQREEGPVIQRIGDVFLNAATEFRLAYPAYVGHLPVAEKRVKDELESNHEWKRFVESCTRQTGARKMDLKHFLSRPSEHLQKYPVLLEAVMQETADGNPDAEFLDHAIKSIKNLSNVATLRTFQNAMGKGPTGKLAWHDLVPKEQMSQISKQEAKRQSIIWELIQSEMLYVRDLELIDTIFIKPLWIANPPIIPRERLKNFLHDVFHNYLDILRPQKELIAQMHEIQREEHPLIRSVTAPVFDAALNWRDAYLEYIPHHPIATYRVEEEIFKNPDFKRFVEQCTRHPDAHKLDIKTFIMRPVARLLRYPLLLQGIMDASPAASDDKETIPQVLEVIKDLAKAVDGGVESAKQKVELWRYDASLTFRTGEQIDLDLRAETRSLIHTGKLLRQPDGSLDISGWTELFVLLFDNYLVLTKPKEKDGIIRYHVNRRPIPLELLTLATFHDPPQQRGTAFLKGFNRDRSLTGVGTAGNGAADSGDSRAVYPCTIHHNGRMGGLYTLYAESADARTEWKKKLDEALALRAIIQDSNKVFEIEPLSADTFFMPSIHAVNAPAWNNDNPMTGKVSCSVPFSTMDGRGLVAVGCAEGVWIGLRHDSKSLKRVLHLKNVTQCAMLEDFGIFLVLAEKALFAYHIEALVPSGPVPAHTSSAPQRLNGSSNVQFFTVGSLHGRTLIIYMKKKGMDSVFRMLEPVVGKINERAKNTGALARFGIGSQKSDWFRTYREFFLPSEAYDVIFLKAKIVILCSKGFEIMDLAEFKSETIPRRDDQRISHIVKRLENCKPHGMYRSSENEFLLCYDQLGLYVDRHGETSRPQNEVVVEWEGTADHVAFHPPYVLLFDSRFIEVRHIETGRLAQIIPGTEVNCTWDGRGASSAAIIQTPGPDGWQETTYQEPRVHGVMKSQDAPPSGTRQRAVVQQVFELVPTVPLYLPGSLQSPNTTTYFPPPESPTPTHSPHPSMSYNGQWR